MKNKKNIVIIIVIILICAIGGIVWFLNNKQEEGPSEISKEFFASKEEIFAGDDIISQQAAIDEELKGYIEDKQYSFNNPKVILNPYKVSPLTALIIFQTSESTSIKVTINNEEVTTTNSTTKHAIPIYGLYAGTDNKIKLTNSEGNTKEITITTAKFEDKVLNIKKADSKLNNDLYFLSGVEGTVMKAFDKNGNIRWYLTTMYSHDIEFLSNGHLLLSNGVAGTNPQTYSGMVEIDYLGKVHKTYNLIGGYHHEANELSDGTIMVASSNPSGERMSDYIAVIDSNTAEEKSHLDLFQIVNSIDPQFASTLENEWAWNNSIYYNEDTKDIVLSLRGRSSVVSINYETQKINWIFGDKSNWSEAFNEYLLTAAEGTRYPRAQHSAFITEDGKLGIFNNDYDAKLEETKGPELSYYKDAYSSATLYEINGKEIKEIWNYDDNKSLFSFAISNFQVLDNGNRLIDFGWEFTDKAYEENRSIREYTGITYARIVEIDNNDNILFDATIDYGQYRVFKNQLYNQNTNNYEIIPSKSLDNTPASNITTVKTSQIAESLRGATANEYEFTISKSAFSISMFITDSDEIEVIFVGDKEDSYIFKYKESGVTENAQVSLNLTGNYAVYLLINGQYYNTNKVIKFN